MNGPLFKFVELVWEGLDFGYMHQAPVSSPEVIINISTCGPFSTAANWLLLHFLLVEPV